MPGSLDVLCQAERMSSTSAQDRLQQLAVPGVVAADLEVSCPRCGATTVLRFYGPCEACRSELRSSQAREQHAVDAPVYEPKMNVTPNSVATKD